MVFPQRVNKERLHLRLHVVGDGVYRLVDVGVVQHHLGRLLGEALTDGVYHVDKARIGKVLDVVHHRGAARLYLLCQVAHVGSVGTCHGEEVEELLNLGEVLQLYLLDEQDIDLGHHVHRLEQVVCKVVVLAEQGVEAVLYVLLEILLGVDLRQYLIDYQLLVEKELVERYPTEIAARAQVEVLPEREAPEVVALHDVAQLGVFPLQAHHARTGKDNLQLGVEVVAATQLTAPVELLEHLVDEQHPAALLVELASKVSDAAPLKVEVVHVDVKAAPVRRTEPLLDILQEERGLADAARTLDAYHAGAPVYLVHKDAAHRGIAMFHKVFVRAVEIFHSCLYCMLWWRKVKK